MNLLACTDNLAFFEALSSETRLRILHLVANNPMNIKEIAGNLKISSAIVTRHVSLLENAGIILCVQEPGIRGLQRICHLKIKAVNLSFDLS